MSKLKLKGDKPMTKKQYDDGVWATLSTRALSALRGKLSEIDEFYKRDSGLHLKEFTFEDFMECFERESDLVSVPGCGQKTRAEICAFVRTKYPDWGKRWRLPRRWRAADLTTDQIKIAIVDAEEHVRFLKELNLKSETAIELIVERDKEIVRLKTALREREMCPIRPDQSSSTTAL